jgi:hypothetical protein
MSERSWQSQDRTEDRTQAGNALAKLAICYFASVSSISIGNGRCQASCPTTNITLISTPRQKRAVETKTSHGLDAIRERHARASNTRAPCDAVSRHMIRMLGGTVCAVKQSHLPPPHARRRSSRERPNIYDDKSLFTTPSTTAVWSLRLCKCSHT